MVKPILQLEQDIVVAIQEFPLLADQLPDLHPIDLEHGNNNNLQLNPPYQLLDFPAGEVNQQNQQQDLPVD